MSKKITPGDMFGFWKVLNLDKPQYPECLCTGCNVTVKKIRKWTLLREESKSCGCQLTKLMKETNQKKYGVDFVQQKEDIKIKSEKTLEEKYGEKNPMKNKEVAQKAQKTKLLKKAKANGAYVFGAVKYNEKP